MQLIHNYNNIFIMLRNIGFFQNNFRYVLFQSFFIGLLLLFFPLTNSFGRDVSFNWIANTDDPPVDGYRLYYKLGAPGTTLNFYFSTSADGSNPSPIELPGQGITLYTLPNLLDSEKYSFVLTAYRGSVESDPTTAILLEAITPPVSSLNAKINTDILSGENPLPVIFDATTSIGDIVSYEWIFGDGTTASSSMVGHTFSSGGNFTVTLKVTDSTSVIDQATVSIDVATSSVINTPPTAAISSSLSVGTTPLSVEFDGLASTDSEGAINSYTWDYGDGGSASGAEVNYTYRTAGMFNAMLTVADQGGLSDTISTPVLLSGSNGGGSNTRPTAVIKSATSKGNAPLTVSFDAGASYDMDGNIENYIWSFGDGTTSANANVTHTFLQPASYAVTLKVKDDMDANSLPATFTVKVLDKDQEDDSILDSIAHLFAIYHLLLGSSSNEDNLPQE